jgi:hypothetical protein
MLIFKRLRAHLFDDLDVFLGLDTTVVHECPVGTVQIDHI